MNSYEERLKAKSTNYGEVQDLAQAVPTREPQVVQKLSALNASIELLEKEVEALHMRLAFVSVGMLRPEGMDERSIPQEACPMADHIQGLIRRTERLRGRIEAIVDGLEI